MGFGLISGVCDGEDAREEMELALIRGLGPSFGDWLLFLFGAFHLLAQFGFLSLEPFMSISASIGSFCDTSESV